MKKLSTLVGCLLIVRVAVAAPTANEDFVIAEDAKTYTNAVNAANAYTDAATTNLDARPVAMPLSSSGRGVTFVDQYGEDQNVAVAIGDGAHAAVTTNALEAAADNKVVRSAGVAVGGHAEVRNDADPLKVQGVAVGWHSTVTAINGVAIGSGAKHPDDDDATTASAPKAIAIGYNAKASATNAVQLGEGVNTEADTLKFRDVTIVKDGKIQGSIDEDQLLADGFTKMDFSESNTVKRITIRNDEHTFQVVTDTNRADGVALTMGDAEIYGTAAVDSRLDEVRTDNAQTRQIVTTWESFLDGSNVVFSITNYISGVYNLDAAKLRILELREGEYHEVYNSRDEILLHIDDFSNRCFRVALDAIVDEVANRLAAKADKDWGKYTSAGGDAPSNTVYMTAPNTVFAGGLEYERVAVGEGSICVLTTKGAPVWTQGDEGTFKFQDDGGTNYFGFAKTDSYTIGANTDGITVQSGMVTMDYNITMSGRPCVWYKSTLSPSVEWEQLNFPDGSPVAGATYAVSWEQNPAPGTQVCYLNVGNSPQGFFRATVEVAGEAKFMTNMPADLSGGIISTNTATGVNGVIRPTFNGSSVIWNWSAK